jgi:hypothetical protein
VAVVIPIVLAMGGMFYLQARRRIRRDGHDPWVQQWRGVDRDRRRRIVRSVRRGEAVSDPRDATLALELIERQRDRAMRMRPRRFWRWFGRFDYLLMGITAISIALVTHDLVGVSLALLPVLYIGGLHLYSRRLEIRVAAAQQKNAQLVDRLA